MKFISHRKHPIAAILILTAVGLAATAVTLHFTGHLRGPIDVGVSHLHDFSASFQKGFPLRGRILACDGTPLAFSKRSWGICDYRYYPLGRAACALTGFCSRESLDHRQFTLAYRQAAGKNGFEKVYDDELAAGRDVTTTIDPRRQLSLHSRLTALRIDTESELAWGVEMCISNETVLAVASLPDYNPLDLNDISESSIYNWAVVLGFHPGNTIRPLLISTNELDEAGLKARLKDLGFGTPIGGFFDEASCDPEFEKPWSPWCCTNTANGALISATSLQLARAFCRLAREGNRVREAYSCRRLMRVKSDSRFDNSNLLQTIVLTEGDRVAVYTIKAPQKQLLKRALSVIGEPTSFDEEDEATVMAMDEYP